MYEQGMVHVYSYAENAGAAFINLQSVLSRIARMDITHDTIKKLKYIIFVLEKDQVE